MSDQIQEETAENTKQSILPNKLYKYSEQEKISDDDLKLFSELNIPFKQTEYEGVPEFLGIYNGWTSYYVGAAHLTDDCAVVVTPKDIGSDLPTDLITLYLEALKFAPSAEYFAKFYGIDFDKPPIECDSFSEQLTPLLIVHFIACLQKVVSRGLKKDYIIREENLQSKVRGRIMIQKNLQKNVFPQRQDRVYCKFQEYTVDIPENRLLKKALVFSANYLNKLVSFEYHDSLGELKSKINQLKSAFYLVSDEIEIFEIKTLRKNKLFKEYSEAIKIAKNILQRFDYSITESESEQKTVPPFWIDMSRLFEVHVYSKLYAFYGEKVKYQVPGRLGSVADFIIVDKENNERLILDAKYKTHYQKKRNPAILADIREISGYARDEKILKALKIEKTALNEEDNLIPCVIIYPEPIDFEIEDIKDTSEIDDIKAYNEKELKESVEINKPITQIIEKHGIPGFRKFYKMCIKLPVKNNN